MAGARNGDTVRVHYTGRLEDGTVFDSSLNRAPLEFTLGTGRVVPGLEAALEGMVPGETKTVWLPADHAFGPHRDDLMLTLARERIPDHFRLRPGMQLRMRKPGAPSVIVTVVTVTDDFVTLDANHSLAGREVTFDVELLAIGG